MRSRLAAACIAMALLLGACASIPTDGPIQYGDGAVDPALPLFPLAAGPRPGDSPERTVRGFLEAAAAGVTSNFSVAREYLTVQANADWDPTARVVVYDAGALTPDYDEAAGVLRYRVPVVAVIDSSGRMSEAAEGDRETVEFWVSQGSDEQWRISGLDNGVLVQETYLTSWFRPVELVFASKDSAMVVPELRWLPNNSIASLAARELLEGPSPWLADAVRTGFPPGASLEVDSVVVANTVASVPLSVESAGSPAERSLAEEQLRLTLTSLPAVTDVEVTVGGLPIGGVGAVALARAPSPDENAAALVADRLGWWNGSQLLVVPDAVGSLPAGARGIARGFDASHVAFLVGGTRLVTTDVLATASAELVALNPEMAPPGQVMDVVEVYSGGLLTEPSYDTYGWLWTADASRPGWLVAVSPDGEAMMLEARSLEGRAVQSLSVSRDGARIALLSTTSGQPTAEVAGVVRDVDGTPLSVSESLPVGAGLAGAVELAWVDDTRLAALGTAPDDANPPPLWVIAVGGRTHTIETVVGVTSISARYGERSITVIAADGTVRVRSGTGWSVIASGVSELAYAG
ncbi:MAG: hypothetical protein CVT64_09765 [Actinobacteria bacterium HGW-Actinobacteria-4]|nr:MAG: hypothetical protein CVT64_09765 [Actinobacteria bacterium HGW-Actinobacteria-4]